MHKQWTRFYRNSSRLFAYYWHTNVKFAMVSGGHTVLTTHNVYIHLSAAATTPWSPLNLWLPELTCGGHIFKYSTMTGAGGTYLQTVGLYNFIAISAIGGRVLRQSTRQTQGNESKEKIYIEQLNNLKHSTISISILFGNAAITRVRFTTRTGKRNIISYF